MPLISLQSQSYRWLIAELTVVVLGILIAFQIDEWRETSNNRQLTYSALEALLLELDDEQLTLQRFITSLNRQGDAAAELVDRFLGQDEITEEWLIATYGRITSGMSWQPHNATYSSLLDSGNLYLINDPNLEADLFLYYEAQQSTESNILRTLELLNQMRAVSRRDIYRVPNLGIPEDQTFGNSRWHVVKPLEDFPRHPEFMGTVGDLGALMKAMVGLLARFEQMNVELQEKITAEMVQL
jgi:hypothetical protein